MKVRLALFAMTLIAVVPLNAQGGGRRGGGAGGRLGGGGAAAAVINIDNLTKQYKLSAEQKTKAEVLVKTYTTETRPTLAWMLSERQAGASANGDSLKKIADARATFDTEFKALLTAPQAEAFDSVRKAQAGRRRGGGA